MTDEQTCALLLFAMYCAYPQKRIAAGASKHGEQFYMCEIAICIHMATITKQVFAAKEVSFYLCICKRS
jgi:hypothetical protein